MPWFKVDDSLAFHGKTVAAGNAALGLWVRAGAWSAQTLTGGRVPDHMVTAFGGGKLAPSLVACGMWERVDGGYQFHDWDKYQPSKESVEAEREAARIRQQRARDAAKARRDAAYTSQDNHAVSHGVTEPLVTVPPSHPVPSPSTKKKSVKPKIDLPETWTPNEKHTEKAKGLGLDVQFLADQFANHHGARGTQFVDWDRAFFTWIGNAPSFNSGRPQLRAVDFRARVNDGRPEGW